MDAEQIQQHLGGDKYPGYFTAPCPICQPEGRPDQRGLSIRQQGEKVLTHCHKSGCGFLDIMTALGVSGGSYQPDAQAIAQAKAERDAANAQRLAKSKAAWDRTQPIGGTPGETYLRGRRITCTLPPSLRWAPDEFHPGTRTPGGAMVGLVEPTRGVHRTYFDSQGMRLRENAKLMLGPCRGGAVRLSGGAGPLVVCEGIETGLSLLSGLLGRPATVWAALSTSGMKGVDLPKAPGELIVAVDGDHPGRTAGFDLMQRAAHAGWKVSHLTPPDGQDWNDVLQSGVAA